MNDLEPSVVLRADLKDSRRESADLLGTHDPCFLGPVESLRKRT